MMKKIIKLLIISLASLLLFGIIFFSGAYFEKRVLSQSLAFTEPVISVSTSTPIEIMTDQEQSDLKLSKRTIFEVVSRDDRGKITSYKIAGFKGEQPVNLEFMGDEEKTLRGIATSSKIQVLERNSDGKATAYKIIKTDADIVTKY